MYFCSSLSTPELDRPSLHQVIADGAATSSDNEETGESLLSSWCKRLTATSKRKLMLISRSTFTTPPPSPAPGLNNNTNMNNNGNATHNNLKQTLSAQATPKHGLRSPNVIAGLYFYLLLIFISFVFFFICDVDSFHTGAPLHLHRTSQIAVDTRSDQPRWATALAALGDVDWLPQFVGPSKSAGDLPKDAQLTEFVQTPQNHNSHGTVLRNGDVPNGGVSHGHGPYAMGTSTSPSIRRTDAHKMHKSRTLEETRSGWWRYHVNVICFSSTIWWAKHNNKPITYPTQHYYFWSPTTKTICNLF